jgi:Ni,Fe-hydrogenase I large subunit
METFINDLISQPTLAPLEGLQEMYNPKNLADNDAKMLASISKSSINAIETSIGALNHLVENLNVYKQCMIDSINLQAESADIATKYAVSAPSASYTLPGIVTVPQSYDLQSIKSDNERMEQVKSNKEKAVSQKRIYFRLAEEDVRVFLQAWKRLAYSDASFEEFIEALNGSINKNY